MATEPDKAGGAAQTRAPAPARRPWLLRGILLGLLAVLLAAAGSFATMMVLHPEIWRDFRGQEDPNAPKPVLGSVCWVDPEPLPPPVNVPPDNVAAGFVGDANALVFARRSADSGDTDLYVTIFREGAWTAPEPLLETNTDANERSPSLSRNGRYLFFHSDRAGGFGGNDLYVAIRGAKGWGRAYNLGPAVNSEFDEMDPHLSPDEEDLWFASNRPKAGLPEEARRARWAETVAAGKPGDVDIFVSTGVDLPDRDDPLRDADFRRRLITQLGGSLETEDSVLAALDWLTKTQEPDGYWETAKWEGGEAGARAKKGGGRKKGQKVGDHDAAATALAALCYYGWGERHDREGPYRKPLLMAIDWLAQEAVRRKGMFAAGSHGMYHQAIVTITLAEALAATGDTALLREPLALCTDVIVKAQDPALGGWRYRPRPEKGDTSVLGWQVTALKRAKAAGLPIPDAVFAGAGKWLDHVSGGKHGGTYGYQDRGAKQVLTAVGMFCRQMMGARPAEARQQESAAKVVEKLPADTDPTDLYFWYYGFLALYQQQGPAWDRWNDVVRTQVLARQERDGAYVGSWTDAKWKGRMDRVIATALATLSLEVYYRYLPMYDFEGVTLEALKKSSLTMRVQKVLPPETLVPLTARRDPVLSSPAAERTPAFTRDGTLFYFSSDRPGGRGGMDLYGALVRAEGLSPVENLGEHINSPRDDVAPTLSDQGYRMVFSSDRPWSGKEERLLWRARSFDAALVDHWANFVGLLGRLTWWLLGAAVGLMALVMLLVWYFRVGRYTDAGLKARCYFASAVVHAALLICFSVWMIKQAMQEQLGGDRYEKIVIGEDTLATERLALELRESINAIEEAPAPLRVDSPTAPEEIPEIVPVRHGNVPTLASETFVIERPEVDMEARPVPETQAPAAATPRPPARPMVRVEIDVETELERESEALPPIEQSRKAEVAPVLKSKEFVATPWAERPGGKPEKAPTEIAESPVPDAESKPPAPSPEPMTGVGAASAARLYGTGDILSRKTPHLDLGAETVLEAPAVAPSVYVFRDTSKRSPELVRQLGGSDLTERAVNDALDWFSLHQEPDGRWSCERFGGEKGHDTAATGAAMLCFFGWGAKHNAEGPHRETIARAIDWLVKRVTPEGNLTGHGKANMYDQGIGTMALAEAYGLTKDPALREPLQRAVDFIVRAQHKTRGGWRYAPGQSPGDLSVGGWQVMALVSAKMAGAEVPAESLRLARMWLDSVSGGPAAGRYGYTDGSKPSPPMTAVGMFCQQLFQVPPHDPRQGSSARYLAAAMPDPKRRDYYYWYYGTIALYQHQGPIWEEWNEKMKRLFIDGQVKGGEHAGSWEPDGRWTRGKGGRVIATAFSTLSLEVYYRYLPLYNTSLGTEAKRKAGGE